MSDQPNLYTLAEASRLTGLSTEALRLRIKRGKLAAEKGNDGQPRVRLTSADLEEFRRQVDQQKPTLTRQDADRANAIRVLETAVDALRERAAKAEGESATLREQVESERGRADKAEARAMQAEREREVAKLAAAMAETEAKLLRERMEKAEHRADRAEALRERAEKAEARADRAEEEARRPFWRRWLGP